MDPLAAYLLCKLKNEATVDTREFALHDMALAELGYWTLVRPVEIPLKETPGGDGIRNDCRYVSSFPHKATNLYSGGHYNVFVDLYVDEMVADISFKG